MKPLLEIGLLQQSVEDAIMFELRNGRKMKKDKAEETLAKMRKEGRVNKAVAKVISGWFE